ncbi:MAG: hypothetical protein V4616_13480 [Bacteroidota bacterium]
MKKSLLIIAVALTTAIASKAQVAAGNFVLTGGIGFSSDKDDTPAEPRTNTFFFTPKFGYFFTDRLAAGILLNVNNSSTKTIAFVPVPGPPAGFNTISTTSDLTSVTGGVFGRYYVPINESFFFWGELDLLFGSQKVSTTVRNEDTNAETTTSVKGGVMDIALIPGFSYFPSTRYSIDLSVGRFGVRNAKMGTVTNTNTQARFDLANVTVGASIFF